MAQNINAGLSLPISLPVDPKRPYQDQQFLQSLSQVATAYVQFGPSSQRPSGASPSPNFIGRSFFDQTLNTPVWWNGTTWVSSTSAIGVFSPNGMMLTSPTGKAEATNPALNGQILIGSTGNSPTLGYIVGGTGITVTNEAGQILITNSSPGITVNNVSDNTTYNLGMTDQSTGAITILDVAAQSLTYNPYSYTLSLGPVLSTTPGILNGPGGLSLSTASNIRLTVDSTGAWLLPTNAGTVNQVITSQGTGTPPIWASPTIQIDDVGTTNTVYNMLFTNVDSGSVNYLDVSTSTLTYNPSSQTINGGLGLNLTSGGVFTATSATNTTISSGANTVISTGNVFTATSVSTTTLSSGGGTTITSTGGNVTVNPAGGLFLSSGTGAALTITSGDRILMQSTQDTTVNSSTLIDITSAQYTHITTGEDFTVTATGDAALIGNNVGLSSSPGGIALNSATSVGIVSGTQLIELISGAALTTSSVTNTTITGGTSVSLVSTSGDTSITSGAAIGTTSTTSTNIAAGTGLNLSSVGNTDFTTGSTLRLAIDNTGAWLLPTSAGTQYQTIQSQGAGTPPIWADESLAITNATTTNATYFPTFISSISGRATTLDISTYFTFNPDLGILSLEPGSTSGPGTITGPLGLKLSTNAVGRLTIDNTGAWLLPSSAGSSLQAIISNGAGTPPTWQGVVNSFQTSLSGLSPSTPATGNVTLSGVLGIASGGTGATTAEQALLNLSSNQILANPGGDLYLFSDRWITSSSSLPVAANGIWQAVAYGNGTFVAVGIGTEAATSVDGITWTAQTMPSSQVWVDITFGNGVFMAISADNIPASATNVAATSPDGVTWTTISTPISAHWGSIYWNGSYWLLTGVDGSFISHTYTCNNNTWTSPSGSPSIPGTAAWNGTFWCGINNNGTSTTTYTSTDGLTWTGHTGAPVVTDIAVDDNGMFCIVGTTGQYVSYDGATWTRTGSTNLGARIIWTGTVFIITSDSVSSAVYESVDAINWLTKSIVALTHPAYETWWATAYGNDRVIVLSQTSWSTHIAVNAVIRPGLPAIVGTADPAASNGQVASTAWVVNYAKSNLSATIQNTSTNATYYPTFVSTTSGTLLTIDVSSSALTFNPSTATLTTTNFAGNASTATLASASTNIAGGSANYLPVQTGVGTTGFITPSTGYLEWTGSAYTWVTNPTSIPIINTTTNASYYLTFVSATSGSVSTLDATSSIYVNPNSNSIFATNFNGQLNGNASTATFATSAGTASTATFATTAGTATSATTATTASNFAGGAANEIVYQTGSGTTSFVTAPSTSNTYLYWNGTSFAWGSITSGTVTSVSVTSANGFAGTVATSTSTPAITLSTTVTGVLYGNGTALSAATVAEINAVGQLNQNTTGNAATATLATTATNIAGGAAGSIPYQTGSGTTTTLPIGSANQILAVNSGGTAPHWENLPVQFTIPQAMMYGFYMR